MRVLRRSVRLLCSPRRSSLLLAALALAVGLAPATASAKETVKFRLVIEGSVGASRNFSVSGNTGFCTEEVQGSFTQATEFLRGKGVILEVSRRRVKGTFEYGVVRAKHSKAEFTVLATSTRRASGTETFKLTPLGEQLRSINPTVECQQPLPDLGTTPGCKVPTAKRYDVGLKITGNNFTVEASYDELAPPLPKPTCGETSLTKGFLRLTYEFPDFAPLGAKPLPDAKMFGRVNAIAVRLDGKAQGKPQSIGTPPLTGSATDEGSGHATVRFIRCGERGQPAC